MTKMLEPPVDFDEHPEWTEENFARAIPFRKAFPEQLASWEKSRGGRPPVEQPKVHIGFRLAAHVVKGVHATAPATTLASRKFCAERWRIVSFKERARTLA